jgi:dGTPase
MGREERSLKAFMYDNLYHHERQRETAARAREVIARLYAGYHQDHALLPDGWRATLPADEPGRSRHIADFIAGMTDRYAMDCYRRIYGTVPQGLTNV